MDCFLTAFSVCSSSEKSVSDAEDAFSGSSSSSSMFCSKEGHGATPSLKRERASALFMRFRLYGMKTSMTDEETMSENGEFLFKRGVQSGKEQSRKCRKGKELLEWWEEGAKKRRKLGNEEWVAGDGNGNALRRVPARFQRLMRRVRAKVRKMGQVQKVASFHYDPLSYSMNFDEGCWQDCEARLKHFYTQ